jgi:hypothetical protein
MRWFANPSVNFVDSSLYIREPNYIPKTQKPTARTNTTKTGQGALSLAVLLVSFLAGKKSTNGKEKKF